MGDGLSYDRDNDLIKQDQASLTANYMYGKKIIGLKILIGTGRVSVLI